MAACLRAMFRPPPADAGCTVQGEYRSSCRSMQVHFGFKELTAFALLAFLNVGVAAKSTDGSDRISMSITSRSGFVEVDGSAEKSIMRVEAPPLSRRKLSSGSVSTAPATPRRGALQPPMPPLDSSKGVRPEAADSKARAEAEAYDARVHSDEKRRLSQPGRRKDTRRQERQGAERWKFRGPTPLPLLEDTRLTHEQKERELERLLEKLHAEFFIKHEMGHSRLAQARNTFYKAVADYSTLTGRQRPAHFQFEELPVLEEGDVELEDDEVVDEPATNVVVVPENKPPCLANCQGGGAICNENASMWTANEACSCLRAWQACSLLPPCTQQQRDTEGFFIALNTRESEVCAWPRGKLYDHLKIFEKGNASNYNQNNDEGGSENLLQRAAGPGSSQASAHSRHSGVKLSNLLEAEERRASAAGVPPGLTNPPTGCRVSHPEMLGDGNCDGGTYNTAACNWDGGDCCDADCRPAMHRCGVGGYQCSGQRVGVRANSQFQCSRDKVPQFTDYFDTLRDKLTLGESMISTSQCNHLTQEEHNNVAQGFNIGVELGYYAKTRSAAAQTGGPELYIDCGLWNDQMGNDWFGTLITHELGHSSGYSHPNFKQQTYKSECENIGSTYCHGHCMEWTEACQNHGIFGSETCGFAGFGCKTGCVHSDYCFSLPERITECFGYQKVHSRSETLQQRVTGVAENVLGFNPFSWIPGFGGTSRPALTLAFAAAWCGLQFVLEGSP